MSERTYPELDVDEMLSESSSAEDTTTIDTDTDTDDNTEVKGYSQGKLPLSALGIAAIIVVALLAVFGIWEYLPSEKQQLREAAAQLKRLEEQNATLSEQLKTHEAYTRLFEQEADKQTHDKEVMLKDIRACAEILRPYGGI